MKNRTTSFFLAFIGILIVSSAFSQELKIFTVEDFDLTGRVKSCLVITDYGKEEFNFNKEGLLTKSVTRYNDLDYDIIHYKYINGEIAEKRLESYRDGELDKNTSIANFYSIDTIPNKKITEKIVSYNKEFLDQYEYIFDPEDKLLSIKRTNNDGIDGTTVEYSNYKGEITKTYYLNGVVQKSVRTSMGETKEKLPQHIVLTKEFLEGEPIKALEQKYDTNDRLISEVHYTYDANTKEFAPQTKKGNSGMVKNYVYQYDGSVNKNWVKKIITPDNTYTTRKIEYYPPDLKEE